MRVLAIGAVLLVACGGPVCTREALDAALAAARQGDAIEVGACEIAGAFVVPDGVTLRGQGHTSVLRSVEGGAAVVDAGDDVVLSALRIAVDHGGLGVHAAGSATLEMRSMEIEVTRGVGAGISGGSLLVSGLELVGPITAATAASAPRTAAETAIFGLVARDAMVELAAVHARGFALGAISIERGRLDWTDDDMLVDIDATRGVGLAVFGAEAVLNGVEIGGLFASPDLIGIAIAAFEDARLSATDVTVCGGAGYGIFADSSDVELARVELCDLGLIGAQVQRGSFVGSDLSVHGNGGAGLALIDAAPIQIERANIESQRTVPIAGDRGAIEMGDGLLARRATAGDPATALDLVLRDVTLAHNPRVGVLVDAADTAPITLELTSVTVGADAGSTLGVVAQRTIVPTGWDMDVMRDALTSANDTAFTGTIEPAGLIMPPAVSARPPPF